MWHLGHSRASCKDFAVFTSLEKVRWKLFPFCFAIWLSLNNMKISKVCLKSSVNPIRKQTKQNYKQIFFIALQSSLHPSQHTFDNVSRAYNFLKQSARASCGVHRCVPGASMRACHAAGPRSIPVGTSFLGEVFSGFFLTCKDMSGSFTPPGSPNLIWPSLLSSIIIHYGHQWPEMLTRPKASNIRT